MPPIAALSTFKGLPAIHLRSHDGAQATALLHGGHLVSWRPRDGEEQLYLSELAVFSAPHAVRGGVPVIFPQFECHGPLVRHGFARHQAWQLAMADTQGDKAQAVLRLTDNEQTRRDWPHGFELELTIRIGQQRLDMELSVNNTGALGFGFTAALHTYIRVNAIGAVCLHGLQNLPCTDYGQGQRQTVEAQDPFTIQGEINRIYHEVDRPIALIEGGRHLSIHAEGFSDTVIWNPGPQKSAQLNDMPPDGWQHMLCIEAGAIKKPVMLNPGQGWVAQQVLTATHAAAVTPNPPVV